MLQEEKKIHPALQLYHVSVAFSFSYAFSLLGKNKNSWYLLIMYYDKIFEFSTKSILLFLPWKTGVLSLKFLTREFLS